MLLPQKMDLIQSAKKGMELIGEVDLSGMKRLGELLSEPHGLIYVDLIFDIDEKGSCFIKGRIHGELPLICQRCNKPFKYKLETELYVNPVLSEAQASKVAEPFITYGELTNPVQIIEDELLLNIPMVPKHK